VRVAILYNPRAGKGRGAAFVPKVALALSGAGHESREVDVTTAAGEVPALLEWAQAVVIVGGDGTLHHTLPALVRTPRPVYHAAMGTENLFAREFGHVPDAKRVAAAVSRGETRTIDIASLAVPGGKAPPTLFAIMASVGPDASIIHRLSGARSGPIRHASYVRPFLRELVSPRVPVVSVSIDGRVIVDGRSGMVVVANMRQYALRLDPAPSADPADGLLDVVFIPGRSLPAIVLVLGAWRLGGRSEVIAARGRSVELGTSGDACLQLDGEGGAQATVLVKIPSTQPRTCAVECTHGMRVFV